MDKTDKRYSAYLGILHEELMPAMGCTEPIAIAYAAAMARRILGILPERVEIEVSENILKNVKSVIVPNTGKLKGIEAAAVAGIVVGDADKVLEVISTISEKGQKDIVNYLKTKDVKVLTAKSDLIFDLIVNVYNGESSASVQISNYHTNIVRITKNGKMVMHNQHCDDIGMTQTTDRSIMNIKDILDFVESVDIEEVREVLQRQIDYNTAISKEGIENDWGANVGSTLLKAWGSDDVKVRAKAMAAAGSDARMSGCELPVIIVSGSGNQGITASIPVIEYAKDLKVDQETLYKALLVSNLVTIHQKTGIGRLSAYCGAVSAGVGAGAGIAWICGGRFEEVAHTIVNALAIVSGIICDGAKPSCAGKIAAAVDAGILGYYMYKNGQEFYGGDGIIQKGVENTIKNIGRLGSVGMRETDKEIIRIMLGK
ncbi:MAG TPA: L-serine ammonia-lyase, iron-sulfur-dependent, subunit alpha [Bacteroidales bacterium]|nr:L-serine ammonia-lyase, iron-sulfur-dependent, subunit alpha [Bacteroidales bacterium]